MRPLIWNDRRAQVAALCVIGWLGSIELTTSRTASREAAARAQATETVIDTTTSRIFDAAAMAALVGGAAASCLCPRSTVRARRASIVAGFFLLVGSSALSVAGRRHLGRFHRDSLTVHADHELVETGPYAHIRHPLYAATIGVFAGIGAVFGNWISIGTAVMPTAALVYRIRVEEAMLVEQFGEVYQAYRDRTSRLLPAVW